MLDPRLLQTFVAVVDSNGFSAAAHRLHATQSAISARIRMLEQQTGRQLLTRGTKSGVAVTADGQLLLDAARNILDRIDRLERDLRPDALAGSARVGMTDDFAMGPNMVTALAEFAGLHRQVALEMTIDRKDRLLAMIEHDELDLALVRTIGRETASAMLRRDALVWVAQCDYALDLDRPVPLICASAPCDVRAAAVNSLEKAGIAWRHAFTSLSLAAQLSAVNAGLGIAPLTIELMRPGLREVENLPALGSVDLVMIERARNSPVASVLGDVIVQAFRDDAARPHGEVI